MLFLKTKRDARSAPGLTTVWSVRLQAAQDVTTLSLMVRLKDLDLAADAVKMPFNVRKTVQVSVMVVLREIQILLEGFACARTTARAASQMDGRAAIHANLAMV